MRQIDHYQLDAETPTSFVTTSPSTLTVAAAPAPDGVGGASAPRTAGPIVWLTIEGERHDYWLRPGNTLSLPADQRVWLSAEGGTIDLHIAHHRAPTFAAVHGTAVTAGFWTRHLPRWAARIWRASGATGRRTA